MTAGKSTKIYGKLKFARELENRTARFTDNTFILCRKISLNIVTREIVRQLVRAAGSISANYIEANESLSKKDFFHRIRICRKESKEAKYWLRRLLKQCPKLEGEINPLIAEVTEFILVFSKIVSKA